MLILLFFPFSCCQTDGLLDAAVVCTASSSSLNANPGLEIRDGRKCAMAAQASKAKADSLHNIMLLQCYSECEREIYSLL